MSTGEPLRLSPRAGHTFEDINISDSARVHMGNHYNQSTNHYYYATDPLELSRDTVIRRLYDVDYQSYANEAPSPHGGTCVWISQNLVFRKWAEEDSSRIFWLYGQPGRGKTVLAKYLVENLHAEAFGDLENLKYASLGHYFILEKNKARRSEVTLLRSLLHQFLVLQPLLRDLVVGYLRQHPDLEASRYGLWEALQELLCTKLFSHTVLVIDGLDELEKGDLENFLSSMTTMVANIRENRPTHCIKVFATSRFDPLISSSFSRSFVEKLELRSENIQHDLTTFIEDEVTEFGRSKKFPRDVIRDIKKAILDKADGTFLWVSLAWADFKDSVMIWNLQAIRAQLESLKKLPSGLPPLYETLLSRVKPKFLPEIRSFLELIAIARRTLSCTEIAQAMAVKDDIRVSSDLDVAFSVEEAIQRICPNLLQIDSAGEVTFLHLSFKDFLLGGWQGLNRAAADRRLGDICVTYLSLEDLEATAIVDIQQESMVDIQPESMVDIQQESMVDIQQESVVDIQQESMVYIQQESMACQLSGNFPFFKYAAQYLASHISSVPTTNDLWIKYSKLARKPAVLQTLSAASHWVHVGLPGFNETPLRAAIHLNSPSLVKRLVAAGYNIDEEHYRSSKVGGTVLLDYIHDINWVNLFVELGADPNMSDRMGRAALHLAVADKLVQAFHRLINLDEVDVNFQDFNGRTPLHVAAASGNFLQTLLDDPRVRKDLTDNKGYTPSEYAALSASWGGKTQLGNFLRISVSDPKDNSFSPLICAAQQDFKEIVLDLIPKVLDINKHRGVDRKGILHWAAINNWDDVIDAAIMVGAAVNQINCSGKTALHYAAELGSLAAARCLLKHGATVHSKDSNGRTAAHAAAVAGFADILNLLLLDSDMDVNEADNENRTLLHWSATWDWRSIMTSVLDHPDLIITKTDCYRRNALHVAAICGCPNVFQFLLEQDKLDIDHTDAFGNTVLHLAARCGSLSVTEIVLQNITKFQMQQRNKWGQSALDVAIRYNSVVVRARLERAGVRSFVVDKPLQLPDEPPKVTLPSKDANTCLELVWICDIERHPFLSREIAQKTFRHSSWESNDKDHREGVEHLSKVLKDL